MKKKGQYIPASRHNPEYFRREIEKSKKKIEKLRVAFDHKYQALENFLTLLVNFASHDIKNSVHNLDGMISTLPMAKSVTNEDISDMKLCVDSIRETLDKFGEFSIKKDEIGFTIGTLFSSLELLHRSQLRLNKIAFEVEYLGLSKNLIVKHDFHTILSMLNNMIINSLTALKDSEVKKFKMSFVGIDDEKLLINISDSGCGISDEIKPKIFEPYFSTKEKGTGVGLTHVKYVAENICNGHVKILEDKIEGYNTNFEIQITIKPNDTQDIDS